MSYVLLLFGSGFAFFLGIAVVLAGFAARLYARQKWLDRVAVITVEIGLLLVVASAAPLPYLVYAAAIAITIVWIATAKSERPWWKKRRRVLEFALVGVWLLAVAIELPYHLVPRVPGQPGDDVHVLGDSLSAGLGDKVVTWPVLLQQRGFHVRDYARAAATTASAMSQAQQIPGDAGIIVVEIGGNDLLAGTSSAQFRHELDRLLGHVRRKSDRVLMFELPLPPLCNEYGRAQRSLASKHGVKLIPKRVLMSVLASSEGTVDSIHLSERGQTRLADSVENIIPVP